MNVVFVAPHPDDESIGGGGTIIRHVARGDRVVSVFLTSGELGLGHLPPEQAWRVREAEADAAAEVLGVAQNIFLRGPDWYLNSHVDTLADALRTALLREGPGVLYLPHAAEWHPDHQASTPIVRAALRGTGQTPALFSYEVWTPLGTFDHVEDVTREMAMKLKAVRCYKSQLRGFRYDRAVRGLNQFRGALAAHCRFAEVFQTLPGDGVP